MYKQNNKLSINIPGVSIKVIEYFNLTPDLIPRFPYVIKIDRESYE